MIEPVMHRTQPLLQAFALLLPNRFVAAFIGEQGLFELRQNVVGNVNVLEYLSQPGAKFFFTEVGQLALAPESSATIVGVAVFLDFSRHHAIVVGATQQPGEREVVLPVFGFVVASENRLNLLKQFGADKGRVRATV
ncbi:MAG: hypothetical protein WCC21_15060 [Candidatus Acidiferrales bacterium]